LSVAADVATLVVFDALLKPSALALPSGEARVRLLPVEDGSWILLPSSDLPPGEHVPLTVETGTGPLRFVLVTRRDAVDLRVHVVPAPEPTGEDSTETLARHLLDVAESRTALTVPRLRAENHPGNSHAQVDSVLWRERRLFATVSVMSPRKGARPWKLVQVRLRATLPDGVLLEWSARLLSGSAKAKRQYHVFTSLLPEGASRLELALDEADSAGAFWPLPPAEVLTLP
jgi:hypothetical protein